MPRIIRTLTCRIDACPGSPLIEGSPWLARSGVDAACVHDEAVSRHRREVARRFRLKCDGAWITATLDEGLSPFLDFMREEERAGVARFGDGRLAEALAYDDSATWYVLRPPHEFNARNRKRATGELLDWHRLRVVGSSRFREAVERAGLRGLACEAGGVDPDPIPGDPRRWYTCLPTAPAGRGLDQPWATPRAEQPTGPDGRVARPDATNDAAVLDRLDPQVAALCGLFPPGKLRLRCRPRLWAPALPDADFAALVLDRGGYPWHSMIPIVRREAAEALMAAGVIGPEMLEPVEVVRDRADAGAAILDEVYGPLPEAFVAEIASRRSADARPDGVEPETPPGPADLVVPPSLDRDALGVEPVSAAEIAEAEARLGVKIPRVLARLMTEVGPVEPWEAPWDWTLVEDVEDLRADDESVPSRMLVVFSAPDGDPFVLDLDRVDERGDCPVLQIDHETNRCVDEWPSLARWINHELARLAAGADED